MLNEYTLERARNFVKSNKANEKFFPKMNFAAPVGWINDPNGVVVFNNELHLFYQYYPYDTVHGKMHWGHTKTKDGLNWANLEVALAPEDPYDKDGVFSGSAIVKGNKLYLMYSGHIETDDGGYKQVQNIAFSEDGVNFTKYENNPVIDENDVPKGSSIVDFRDPKVFERDGKYYTVIGSKTDDEKGQVLLYKSDDLLNWEFKSVILPYNEFLGDMVECPDLVFFENKDAFLLSAMNYTDKETGEYFPHISWIIEGKVDWEAFVFEVESVRKMDGGFDYYAPQTALSATNPNEYTAIAWQQAWNRTLPTHDQRHQWSGQMTIPRVLKEENNKIMQYPSPKLMEKLLITDEVDISKEENNYGFDFDNEYVSFSMDASNKVTFTLKNNNNENISVVFDGENQRMKFSRKETIEIVDSEGKLFDEIIYPVPLDNESWNIEIFVDTSSIQVFVNNYYTLTSTFYAESPLTKVELESKDLQSVSDLKIGRFNKEDGVSNILYGAIEAGGTKFICAVSDESLSILERISIPTTTPNETLDQVIEFFNKFDISIIGVGSFGPINVNEQSDKYGYITHTPKAGWKDFNFKGMLESEFNVPVLWTTDVNAAAYGEFKLGEARNSSSVLYLTVGTGVGGGLIRDGEIVNGYTHPEMGHLLVRKSEQDDFDGTCPYHGDCLEGLASGFAIEKRTGIIGKELRDNHPIWDYVSDYLAQALMTYTLTMSPEKIILGGGVMKQKHLLDLVKDKFENLMNHYMDYPVVDDYIHTPGLGDDAGIVGCLSLAKDNYKE